MIRGPAAIVANAASGPRVGPEGGPGRVDLPADDAPGYAAVPLQDDLPGADAVGGGGGEGLGRVGGDVVERQDDVADAQTHLVGGGAGLDGGDQHPGCVIGQVLSLGQCRI